MAARLTPGGADGASEEIAARGLVWRSWVNGAGDSYRLHSHEYLKVLVCKRGSITFHTRDGDIEMQRGDRLDLEPGTEHAATVGSHGCECAEVWILDTG